MLLVCFLSENVVASFTAPPLGEKNDSYLRISGSLKASRDNDFLSIAYCQHSVMCNWLLFAPTLWLPVHHKSFFCFYTHYFWGNITLHFYGASIITAFNSLCWCILFFTQAPKSEQFTAVSSQFMAVSAIAKMSEKLQSWPVYNLPKKLTENNVSTHIQLLNGLTVFRMNKGGLNVECLSC